MSLSRKILSITKPSILLDEIAIIDRESPGKPLPGISNKESRTTGDIIPAVMINGYTFDGDELSSIIIDETGFLPTVQLVITTYNGIFLSTSYPKDGDLISVYIRSKIKELKPIRCDFEITGVSSPFSYDNTGEYITFTFNGFLRVPFLFTEHCKAFKDKNSFDALLAVSKELKVGFASNETVTTDKMTWLCGFNTYDEFIKETTMSAYKDEDSFYGSFIDKYYYLNFVNINNQFSEKIDIDNAFELLNATGKDYLKDSAPKEVSKDDYKLILSNMDSLKGTTMFIEKYTLLNKVGQVNQENGYRRYVQFWDQNFKTQSLKEKYQSFFVEPTITKNVKNKILLRGRPGEDIVDKHNKYKWLGTQHSGKDGNVHDNFLFAKVLNWQNREELEKLVLKVQTSHVNLNIYRGMTIPIVIVNTADSRKNASADAEEPIVDQAFTVDRFLSGSYMVIGIKYKFDISVGLHKSELYLAKREWDFAGGVKNK
jgi:hypothetical protein